jgi:excisionase family DNA binding protein
MSFMGAQIDRQARDLSGLFPEGGYSLSATAEILLTIDEVAQILRMHRNTVCRHIKRGDLPGFKVGVTWRVYAQDLRDVLARKAYGNG